MKILLITPLAKYTPVRWLPLGLSYISASLKKNGHKVILYDRFLRNYILKDEESVNSEMKSEILKFKPDIIGMSTYSSLISDTAECARFIRKFFSGIIVAGGHHASAMPMQTLIKIPDLDYVFAGESEFGMLALANGNAPENIKGLFHIKNNISDIKKEQIKNLDELPLPDYSIFDMDYYARANRYTLRGFFLKSASIITSRGCYNKCSFCTESLTFGRGVRFHSADYVLENIQILIKDYGIEGLYFHDNDFLSSPSHAEGICKKIIKNNLNKKLKWVIQANVYNINNDLLKLLSEAGCVKIELGIESLKDSNLISVNKKPAAHIIEKSLLLCKKNNIKAHTYFMFGFKDENKSDLENLIGWIKKYRPHTFNLSVIKVYPGTLLYRNLGNNFFEENSWTRNNVYDYFEKKEINTIKDKEIIKWYREIFYPFYKRYELSAALKVNSLKTIIKMAYLKYFQH